MFLPYPRVASVGSFKRPPSGPAADVTPNVMGNNGVWCDPVARSNYIEDCWYFMSNEQITGITTTITLRAEYANSTMQLWVRKNYSTDPSYGNYNLCDGSVTALFEYGPNVDPNFASLGWTQLNNNATFTAVNNDWIAFACSIKSGIGITEAVQIKNVSDNNTVIASFSIYNVGYC